MQPSKLAQRHSSQVGWRAATASPWMCTCECLNQQWEHTLSCPVTLTPCRHSLEVFTCIIPYLILTSSLEDAFTNPMLQMGKLKYREHQHLPHSTWLSGGKAGIPTRHSVLHGCTCSSTVPFLILTTAWDMDTKRGFDRQGN